MERAGLFVPWKVSQGLMHALALRAGNARPRSLRHLLRKCHLPLHKGGFGRCGGENKNPAGAGASAGGNGLDGEGGEPPSQVLFH